MLQDDGMNVLVELRAPGIITSTAADPSPAGGDWYPRLPEHSVYSQRRIILQMYVSK